MTFEDATLEAQVRTALSVPTGPIDGYTARELASLSIPAAGVVKLTGLQCFTGLKTLKLLANAVNDITPIGKLASITNPQSTTLRRGGQTALAHLGPPVAQGAARPVRGNGRLKTAPTRHSNGRSSSWTPTRGR